MDIVTAAIQQAIEQLITNHRSEFDVLVTDTLKESDLCGVEELLSSPATMESIHQDNVELWRVIGDVLIPTEDPYEGYLDD